MPDHTSLDGLLEDYATTPVPESKTHNGWSIGMVNGGLAFAVPGLITGLEIGSALGLEQSIYAFLLGGLILSILGTITGIVGMKNRLSSCMTMKFVFGLQGANIVSLAFVISLLGWYGVNINLFSDVTEQLLLQLFQTSPSIWVIDVVSSFFITITTIWGFKIIERVSSLFVPILFMLVAYMLYKSIGFVTDPSDVAAEFTASSFTFGEAVSAVVGSFIVSVVLMPDFSRFAAKPKDAAIASFLPFLGISNFVYIAAAMAGLAVKNSDVLAVMLTLGLGVSAFLLLIASSWVTNVVNLYSAALGFNAIKPTWHEWKIIIGCGILGAFMASLNLLDSFTHFIFSLSIIFSPVASIYTVDFFIIRRQRRYNISELPQVNAFNIPAIIAWGCGISASLMANQGWFTLTSIEVCDAMLVTVPVYFLAHKWAMRSNASISQ
ncbi:cytosine permease [uncultured Shewanella sp.]|jgi:cytosine permease|uniref:cytosine permease n=1 Tax=uncultured Shewanella sp. TaxID=173975 RepID=UPI0037048127